MANTATAQTALPVRGKNFGSVTPVNINLDNNADLVIEAGVTNRSWGVVGGQLYNAGAAAQVLIVKTKNGAGTATEIGRVVIPALTVVDFSSPQGGLMNNPKWITQPGDSLVFNPGGAGPIDGCVYLAESPSAQTGTEGFVLS